MAVCNLYLIVHVLSVWLVTCLSVKVKDSSRSIPTQHKLPNLNFSTRSTATGLAGVGDYPCFGPRSITEDFTVCGDGYCRCRDTVADCSEHYGKLTYVPTLPTGISKLRFILNRLGNIYRDDFFVNITSVTDLNLSFNNLAYISPGVFRPFTNLTALRLYSTRLTYTTLAPVLSVTTLSVLDLTGQTRCWARPLTESSTRTPCFSLRHSV
ncbi:hypothetical protein BaRGS_00019425 [Batillaria attramentaria]|uniref:LRRNT domain-containing protein n=1 Tax=Batillaria attramentaria TaxID=370345 RepID=A0ABD0KQ26_9CAEN